MCSICPSPPPAANQALASIILGTSHKGSVSVEEKRMEDISSVANTECKC